MKYHYINNQSPEQEFNGKGMSIVHPGKIKEVLPAKSIGEQYSEDDVALKCRINPFGGRGVEIGFVLSGKDLEARIGSPNAAGFRGGIKIHLFDGVPVDIEKITYDRTYKPANRTSKPVKRNYKPANRTDKPNGDGNLLQKEVEESNAPRSREEYLKDLNNCLDGRIGPVSSFNIPNYIEIKINGKKYTVSQKSLKLYLWINHLWQWKGEYKRPIADKVQEILSNGEHYEKEGWGVVYVMGDMKGECELLRVFSEDFIQIYAKRRPK
ncbi:hypothetical protein KY366_07610 [Candidatus Woesearchaeota archaeon]|nr:hypothetical protein [Candidatus Woesearchaeota archaeon]